MISHIISQECKGTKIFLSLHLEVIPKFTNMENIITGKDIWDSAAKAGLVLGAVSCAYMGISQLLSAGMTGSTGAALLASLVGILLWVAKFVGCIYLMKFFMKRFASAHPGLTNNDTFKFGMATALLSALIYSGFYLAYVTIIAPDTFSNALETVMESYGSMMGEDAIEAAQNMNMASISFFTNLIYCFLFGTVLSSIFSRNIPSRNPFEN